MPETICSNFVYLDFANLTGRCLNLRLKPTEFDLDSPQPVLRVSVSNIEDLEDVEKKIVLLKEYGLLDVETDGSTLSVWPEASDDQIDFMGSVAWAREVYTVSDYVDHIRFIEECGARDRHEIASLDRRIDKASGFIDRALDRLQRRLEFAVAETPQAKQKIQLLRSVRRQLEED